MLQSTTERSQTSVHNTLANARGWQHQTWLAGGQRRHYTNVDVGSGASHFVWTMAGCRERQLIIVVLNGCRLMRMGFRFSYLCCCHAWIGTSGSTRLSCEAQRRPRTTCVRAVCVGLVVTDGGFKDLRAWKTNTTLTPGHLGHSRFKVICNSRETRGTRAWRCQASRWTEYVG